MTTSIIAISREVMPKLLAKLYHLYYETDVDEFDIREDAYRNGDIELRVNTDLVYLELHKNEE